jgi:uncharacterized membrane protein (DUF2068 family)
MRIWAVAYGITGFASALGLWRYSEWSYKAFLSFSIVIILATFDVQFGAGGMFRVPLYVFIPWVIIVILLRYLFLISIQSRLNRKLAIEKQSN